MIIAFIVAIRRLNLKHVLMCLELYEICMVRAKDKLAILRDADSDSLSSLSG
jgi:hypothetical protein